jgi:pyruvate kinase
MDGHSIEQLLEALRELRDGALRQESELGAELGLLHPNHAAGGRNLAHYLAIRQHDVRDLQRALSHLGLSSLGRLERCVLATLNAVELALLALDGRRRENVVPVPPTDFVSGESELSRHAAELLGPLPVSGRSRVMVTLPVDSSAELLDELVRDGTGVFRINCSKADREHWQRLVDRVRAAERRQGQPCRILCDLAGPNPRTLALKPDELRKEVIARVSAGDRLLLAKTREAGERAGKGAKLPLVGCTLPSIVDDLHEGERVFYDDGKVCGVVRSAANGLAEVEITHTLKPHAKLRHDKGLNFPDSRLKLPSLTEKDLQDLDFVVRHADLVGLSFLRHERDIQQLREELRRRDAEQIGIVLKIETLEAFGELPRLLLASMQGPRVGVMVARGDMAVELGYERLAEAQEEILWLCEAALVPVIWATQVLDTLNKTGVPSRAEVTDAAMSGRAECVMLNQGEHLAEAVRFLCGVLDRMQEHQAKKRSLLRRLSISDLSQDRAGARA